MPDPRYMCIKFCFSIFAILFTILMISLCIYQYSLNEDWPLVSLKPFTENDILYPSTSICVKNGKGAKVFTKQEGRRNLEENGIGAATKNETSSTYQTYLEGCLYDNKQCRWNDSFPHMDYDDQTTDLHAHVMGLSWSLEDGTKHWWQMQLNANNKTSQNPIRPSISISQREPHEKCVTMDAPKAKITSLAMLINNSIFTEGQYPENEGFSVRLHFPNQLLAAKVKKNQWAAAVDSRQCDAQQENRCSKSNHYTMRFDIQQMSVGKRRADGVQKCQTNWKYFDEETKRIISLRVGCAPKRWKMGPSPLPFCTKKKQMQQIHQIMIQESPLIKLGGGDDALIPLPCVMIENAIYTFQYFTGLTTFDGLRHQGAMEAFNGSEVDLTKTSPDGETVSEILIQFQVCNFC